MIDARITNPLHAVVLNKATNLFLTNKFKNFRYSLLDDIDNLSVVLWVGKPLANRELNVGLYKAEWNWWYNESNYNLLKFNSADHVGAIKTARIKTNANQRQAA